MTPRRSLMASQLIGYTRIRIRERRQGNESAILDNWFGIAQVYNQKLPFATSCNVLEVDDEYDIIYERTELPMGEAGIRIHEAIS